MLHRIGRFLQLLGLLIAPVGLAGSIARPELISQGRELGILALGVLVFGLGWSLQRSASPP